VTMRLFDTARQEVVPFEPGPVVTLYTCGLTPYDATHLGHASTFLLYDVLERRLRDLGHQTRLVRNLTDVDDPLVERAQELGVDYLELAAAETARFKDDMAALGVLPAWKEPEASGAIDEIRRFVQTLLEREHAYRAGGAVFFDVATAPGFGSISHLDEATMLRLAAERGGNPEDPRKRHRLDFVLWQPSSDGYPAWPSPWGSGRPGWHVECSVLALRELGETIDLHGGGTDLIFPHHECEAAESEAVTGKPFVRHWLHAPMVRLDGTKMSKSLGNLVFVSDLRKRWAPAVIRLAALSRSYRRDWDWDDRLLEEAATRLDAWRAAGPGDAALDDVRDRLDDDLDIPGAMAAVDAAAAGGDGGGRAAALLGVDLAAGAAP
jgi:L-cysteine:1D-myo-inositol 2-amino-2-deoxy-alpha-D-glucopyranoside ligase